MAAPAGSSRETSSTGVLFAAIWLSLLAPGGLDLLPSPLDAASALVQTGVWLALLIHLVARTGRGPEPA